MLFQVSDTNGYMNEGTGKRSLIKLPRRKSSNSNKIVKKNMMVS